MTGKLVQGDKLPPIELTLTDGRTLALPTELPGRYLALLFYRGHWCPFCRRHLASYQQSLDELETMGVTVIGASVDPLEPTRELVEQLGLTFPVAYGVTEQQVAMFDPWWTADDHGRYIQPMELLVLRGGTIFGSVYASGPVGRVDVDEVLNAIRGRERRRIEQEKASHTSA